MPMSDELKHELSMLSDDERHAVVRKIVDEILTEKLAAGELVVLRTLQDGTHVYRKADELTSGRPH
jgi:hypothetical protein